LTPKHQIVKNVLIVAFNPTSRSRLSLFQNVREKIYAALNFKPNSEDVNAVGFDDSKTDTDVTVETSLQEKTKIFIFSIPTADKYAKNSCECTNGEKTIVRYLFRSS
jgi:hypothetical protein